MPRYSIDSGDRWLTPNICLSRHASRRWRERTPDHSCVDSNEAFRSGEEIKHPQLARQHSGLDDPDRAIIYREQDWGVVFILEHDYNLGSDNYVIVTVVSLAMIEYGPTRDYLYAHGPHGGSQS